MKDLEMFPRIKSFYALIIERYGDAAPPLGELMAKFMNIDLDDAKLQEAKQNVDDLDPFSESLTDAEKKAIHDRAIVDPIYFIALCMRPVPPNAASERTEMVYHLADTFSRMQMTPPANWDDTLTEGDVIDLACEVVRFCGATAGNLDFGHLFTPMVMLSTSAQAVISGVKMRETLVRLKEQGRVTESPSKPL